MFHVVERELHFRTSFRSPTVAHTTHFGSNNSELCERLINADLERHPADNEHLFASVWVVG